MARLSRVLTFALFIELILAHGGVSNYTVGETWYAGYTPESTPESQIGQPWLVNRAWASINPIYDPTLLDITCNSPGTPASSSILIEAGQNISAIYYYWLHNVGPSVAWMASCNGPCSSPSFNASDADWFKIGQKGLLYGTIVEGMWFQHEFQDWTGGPNIWTETVPKDLKAGEYLIRHEIVALHIANQPQWYPECAHLKVSGSGKKTPGKKFLAKLPGAWSLSQPEIGIDIYSDEWYNRTSYNIPGPPVWNGEQTARPTFL